MSLSDVASFFDQSVPIGVVFLIVYMVKIGQSVKYIDEKLENHVTDTNKKIDGLKSDMNLRFDDLKKDMISSKQDMTSRMDRIESKLDDVIKNRS